MLDAATRQQLDALFTPPRGAYFEIRSFPRVPAGVEKPAADQLFMSTAKPNYEQLEAWIKDRDARGHEIYVGVNPRMQKRGTKDDVKIYTSCFVDIDGCTWDRVPQNFPLSPTMAVHSGYGTHLYWRTNIEGNYRLWESIQRGIFAHYQKIGACPACTPDESRVLRLAPFPNRKQLQPVPTKIILCNPGMIYTADQLRKAFPFVAALTREENMAKNAADYEGRLGDRTIRFIRNAAAPEARKNALAAALDDCKAAGLGELEALKILIEPCVASGFTSDEARSFIVRSYGNDPTSTKSPADRCVQYLRELPNAIQGQKGSIPTLQAACECWRFGLSRQEAEGVMRWYSETKCDPPWSEKELAHKLDDAWKKVQAAGDFGCRLAEAPPPRRVTRLRGKPKATETPDTQQATPPPPPPPRHPNSAPPKPAPAAKPELSNTKAGMIADPDNPGQSKGVSIYKPASEILEDIFERTGDWPRLVSGMLCAVKRNAKGEDSIIGFANKDAFFAWLFDYFDVVWNNNPCFTQDGGFRKPISEAKFYEFCLRNARFEYDGATRHPHRPIRDDVYYHPWDIDDTDDGQALGEFIGRMNADTDLDRALLLAALLTPAWGGGGGLRPAFLVTSDYGQGAGKTETVRAIARVFGGVIDLSPDPRLADRNRQRLLSEDAMRYRCAFYDNIKSKLEGQEVESLITAEYIEGHRMYHGQARRLNLLSWFFTLNTPQTSKDIAERSYTIRIGKPQHEFNFADWAGPFITKNATKIVNACCEILTNARYRVKVPMEAKDRWGAWLDHVLAPAVAYLNDGDTQTTQERLCEIALRNRDARKIIDTDLTDAHAIREFMMDYLKAYNFRPDRACVRFRSSWFAHYLTKVMDRRLNVANVIPWVNRYIGKKPLDSVKFSRSKGYGYYFWLGEQAMEAGSEDGDQTPQWTEIDYDKFADI